MITIEVPLYRSAHILPTSCLDCTYACTYIHTHVPPLQAEETSVLLFDLKTNLQMLEDVLTHVKERYTLDLCQFLRATLCRNYKHRPSSLDLVELPYVQKCLSLNGSALFKGSEGEYGCYSYLYVRS